MSPPRLRHFAFPALMVAGSSPAAAASVPLALPDDPAATATDRAFISRTDELARESAARGDGGHGALLVRHGQVALEFASATRSMSDPTQHAETGLIALASRTLGQRAFADAILYTGEEPCIMCMGAIRAAGLRTFVYGTTSAQARQIGGRSLPARWLASREVFQRLEYPIAIRGPLLEAEGLKLLSEHEDRRTASPR